MKLRCWLFGCREHAMEPLCVRCGALSYDGDFQQAGKLTPLANAWRGFLRWLWTPKEYCPTCGVKLPRGVLDGCPKCGDPLLPF
jgi:hypothetical protein